MLRPGLVFLLFVASIGGVTEDYALILLVIIFNDLPILFSFFS